MAGEISSYKSWEKKKKNKKSKLLLQKLHLNTSVERIAHLTARTSLYSYTKFGLEKGSLNILFIPLISFYVSSLDYISKKNFPHLF